MGLFDKFRDGLKKTQDKLVHEIKRIVTFSPRMTEATLEELEIALIGADFGTEMTEQIVEAVRRSYETQGGNGLDVFGVARAELQKSLGSGESGLKQNLNGGVTVVSVVGVNGTGKTTTCAKLAHYTASQGKKVMLGACDTFRAAAIEQLKLWGGRLNVPVIASAYGADPASVAHDAVSAALAREVDYLFIDTAGRLHTKSNLMQELQKLHRVIGKQLPGAPHEVLLVLDATTGMNALTQAREFHKAVNLTGLVITKLDGTSKGGMVAAIGRELNVPVKFVGLGEQADDLQPFDPASFAAALFPESETTAA
ncbi:MAG TPA: signal recognition particle-docking protein FtsY [Candidatus Kapabacteria bacterium]|jgi:fused signal recognition particle receptor|nr:signal recognition particle-docking protein FtsY [Candidatus Kapabacteria bacterium]